LKGRGFSRAESPSFHLEQSSCHAEQSEGSMYSLFSANLPTALGTICTTHDHFPAIYQETIV
jgi:hypothetical protein